METQDSIPPAGEQLPLCANPECGKEFTPGRSHNTHCSKRCAGRARFLIHPELFKRPPIARDVAPTAEELLLDVAWEARNHIADLIGCRVCATAGRVVFAKTPLGQKKTGHLAVHHPEMTVNDYKAAYPCARLTSFVYVAMANVNSGRGGSDVQELMANFADKYVTGQELLACRTDIAEWEKHRGITDFVVCLRCGFKASQQLRGGTGHLGLHGWTVEDYRREYPGAPTKSVEYATAEKELSTKPEVRARRKAASLRWKAIHPMGPKDSRARYYANPKNREKIRKAHAQIRKDARELHATALPDDWRKKPADWVFIGFILKQQDHVSNPELAALLDRCGFPCKYRADWELALSGEKRGGSKRAMDYIWEIRDWVGKPARPMKAAA